MASLYRVDWYDPIDCDWNPVPQGRYDDVDDAIDHLITVRAQDEGGMVRVVAVKTKGDREVMTRVVTFEGVIIPRYSQRGIEMKQYKRRKELEDAKGLVDDA